MFAKIIQLIKIQKVTLVVNIMTTSESMVASTEFKEELPYVDRLFLDGL